MTILKMAQFKTQVSEVAPNENLISFKEAPTYNQRRPGLTEENAKYIQYLAQQQALTKVLLEEEKEET